MIIKIIVNKGYKLVLAIILIVASMALIAMAEVPTKLINALEQVESGGDPNAVGDAGRAVGCLQIWKIYVKDVNRISGLNFTLQDRLSCVKSRQMVVLYLSHYATQSRLGHKPTLEDMARIHVGGPNGYKKASTISYWNKVKAAM